MNNELKVIWEGKIFLDPPDSKTHSDVGLEHSLRLVSIAQTDRITTLAIDKLRGHNALGEASYTNLRDEEEYLVKPVYEQALLKQTEKLSRKKPPEDKWLDLYQFSKMLTNSSPPLTLEMPSDTEKVRLKFLSTDTGEVFFNIPDVCIKEDRHEDDILRYPVKKLVIKPRSLLLIIHNNIDVMDTIALSDNYTFGIYYTRKALEV